MFDKFKQGLKTTTQLLNTDVRDLSKRQGRLVDDGFLKELLAILIKTDIGTPGAESIVAEIDAKYRARVVRMDDLLASVKATLKGLMAQESPQ